MSIGLRTRQQIERANDEPPRRDTGQQIGAYVLGVLAVLILIGVAVDAFVRPAYSLLGQP